MTSETRPVCVYAIAGLRRNSNRLMIVMCIGIAFALYGVYVGMRHHSNPSYVPSVSAASSWLYNNVGQLIMKPKFLKTGVSCTRGGSYTKNTFGHLLMRRFVYPTMRYSGLLNGLINLAQIAILRMYSKSVCATDTIIGLSAFGLVVSFICLVGSFASCRLMCISCLGIHHKVIIYLAAQRRRMVQSILCPSSNLAGLPSGTCSFGAATGGGGGSGSGSGGSSGGRINLAPPATGQQSAKHTSSCVTRRTGSDNHDQSRRRSNRL